MADETVTAQQLVALALSGGLGAAGLKLFDTIVSKRRTPEQRLGETAEAAAKLMELAMNAAGSNVTQLLERISALEESHAECETRCVNLSGELAQANQKIDSLVRLLKDPQSTKPGGPLHGAVIEFDGGDVRVFAQETPARRRRKPDAPKT